MSVDSWTQTPYYTVLGIGPYAITHPYTADAIQPSVIVGDVWIILNPSEYSLSATSSADEGNLYLTPATAATHAGRSLVIERVTPDQQGWLPVLGEREAGLAAQLDRMVQGMQEIRSYLAGSVRIRDTLTPFVWADGTVPIRSGNGVISGPTATAISAAQEYAEISVSAAAASAASAEEALAKQNSMLRDKGQWVTGTYYSPSDSFDDLGNVYMTNTAHFATSIAADLSAGRIRLWVQKGAAGAGTGDMLYDDNLAGLTNKPLAFATIGGKAVGKVDLLTFGLIDPSALISDVKGLAGNSVPNAIPVAKAVTDYVDAVVTPAVPIAVYTWTVNTPNIPLPNLDGWDEVEVIGEITNAGPLYAQVSPDNLITVRASGYLGRVEDDAGATSFVTGLGISKTTVITTKSFRMVVSEMSKADRRTKYHAHTHNLGSDNDQGAGVYNTPEICNALRITAGANQITAGYVEVYGLRRAVIADTIAPVLVASFPVDDAIGIALDVSPILFFSENVIPGTGLIALRQNIAGTWSNVEQFNVVTEIGTGVGQISFSGNAVSFNPTNDLVPGREYAIRILATCIRDLAGNFFAGITTDTAIRFTTAASVIPTLVETTPMDEATNVAITVSPVLVFSEAVVAGTGNIVLRQNIAGIWSELESFDVVAQAGTGNGQVSFAASSVTINPIASLVAGREYAIRVPATAVRNSVGNFFAGIANDDDISFSTVAAVAPTFVILSLIDNEVTYQLSGSGTVHWSVDDAASPTGTAIDAGTGAYAFGNFNAAPGNNVVSLNFTGTPAGARRLHLVATSVGLANYGTPQHFNINVVATDAVAPTIISTVPSDNATGVAVGTSLTLTFSEAVAFGTGLITLRQNIASVWSDLETFDVVTEVGAGNGQVSISGAVLTINPTADMTASREYAIRIAATAIDDLAGNSFVGITNDTTVSFTTAAGADVTAPTLSSVVPADNATGVAATVSPALTFSEAVAFGTGLITLRENNGGWADLETFDVATEQGTGNGQVSISGAVLTINPTATLTASREYAIRIAASAIDDLAGNSYAGIANDTTVSFTVAAAGYTRQIIDNNGTGRHTSGNETEHRESLTFAGWFNTDTISSQAVLANWGTRSEIRRFTDALNIHIEDSSAAVTWDVQVPSVFAVGTWVHIFVQVDLAAVTAVVKINGATIGGGGMTINTALTGGTGLIYMNGDAVEILHTGAGFIFNGLISDIVIYHTTSAAKPSADFYAGGSGTDPTVIGTPYVVLGGTMEADQRAGNAGQGWNDSYTPGSATVTTNSATYSDA